MAIFDRKSHAPETSEGSESGSILLVRLFFICQATFLSFDILSVAWAERGFGGGLVASLTQLRVYDCAPSFHVRDEGRPVHPPSPFPIAIFLHVTSVYGMIRAARKVTAALVYVKIVAAKEKRIIRNMTS